MNDNGLPQDPLSAAQFNVPALSRLTIPQNVDRTFGEYFPNVAGDYLRVESCDMAARLSFNNNDFSQSVPLLAGTIIEGNFSGVTIWHENYSNYIVQKPKIVLAIGRGSNIQVDSQGGFSPQLLPWTLQGLNTTVYNAKSFVPFGCKKLSINAYLEYTNATAGSGFLFSGYFLDINGINISQCSAITKNSITFSNLPFNINLGFLQGIPAAVGNFGILFPTTVINVPTNVDSFYFNFVVGVAVTAIITPSVNIFAG